MTTTDGGRVPAPHASSTGQALAEAGWLDAHFEMCRPEYEAMVASVGFQPGWSVLDAGCGPGSYFPVLAGMIGESGSIHGIDLAPENVETIAERVASWNLQCDVTVRTGSILDLPYEDDTFDVVLCSAPSTLPTMSCCRCFGSSTGWFVRAGWWRSRIMTAGLSAGRATRRHAGVGWQPCLRKTHPAPS